MSRCMQCGSKECYSSNCGDPEFNDLREQVDELEDEICALKSKVDSQLDWIVNRAVELGRKRDKIVNVWDAGSYYTSEEILEQIKKELGEKL